MRTIKATDLARRLGISRRTMSWICKKDTALAFKKQGVYFIRLTELAKRPGFTLISALMIPHSRWIKATDLARISGVPLQTMNTWCRNRPNFAKRISNTWYVDLELLGATDEQIEQLLGQSSQSED